MIHPIQSKQLSADGFTWNQYSPRVGAITNELTHFAPVAYFAFDTWDDAHAFWKSITDKRLCSRAHVRESERFTSLPWEVKVWSMSESTLEKLVHRDAARGGTLSRDHRNRTKPKSLPLPPLSREWQNIRSYDAIAYEAT